MSLRAAFSAAEAACASTCSYSTPKPAVISGPSGSTSSSLIAHLVAAEARRAEQAPNPDSMDLYFQGMAWFNKGRTPDNVALAHSFFDRALAVDPGNVDALVGSARANVTE